MGDRVLAPVNGSSGDTRLIETLASMCQGSNSQLTLVYVVEVPQAMPLDAELPADLARGERVLASAEAALRQRIGNRQDAISTELLQARSAGAAIVDEAIERRATSVVMATENRMKLGKVTFGDSAAYVMKNCPCEVILLRLAPPDREGDH